MRDNFLVPHPGQIGEGTVAHRHRTVDARVVPGPHRPIGLLEIADLGRLAVGEGRRGTPGPGLGQPLRIGGGDDVDIGGAAAAPDHWRAGRPRDLEEAQQHILALLPGHARDHRTDRPDPAGQGLAVVRRRHALDEGLQLPLTHGLGRLAGDHHVAI